MQTLVARPVRTENNIEKRKKEMKKQECQQFFKHTKLQFYLRSSRRGNLVRGYTGVTDRSSPAAVLSTVHTRISRTTIAQTNEEFELRTSLSLLPLLLLFILHHYLLPPLLLLLLLLFLRLLLLFFCLPNSLTLR